MLVQMLNYSQADQIMKNIEELLEKPATDSILVNNLNSFRVMLVLYQLVDQIQNEFAYSTFISNLIKEKIIS